MWWAMENWFCEFPELSPFLLCFWLSPALLGYVGYVWGRRGRVGGHPAVQFLPVMVMISAGFFKVSQPPLPSSARMGKRELRCLFCERSCFCLSQAPGCRVGTAAPTLHSSALWSCTKLHLWPPSLFLCSLHRSASPTHSNTLIFRCSDSMDLAGVFVC